MLVPKLLLVASTCLAALFPAGARAQEAPDADIVVTVTDEDGEPVTSATIRITAELGSGRSFAASLRVDDEGEPAIFTSWT